MGDYVVETSLAGDIHIATRTPSIAWLDVDTDDGTTNYPDRWATFCGRGGCGPCMPWAAWVALAEAVIERHGSASSVVPGHTATRIQSGWRMAIERQDDGQWRGVSPRNGTYASCEGTLAEAVQLARGILAHNAERS